MREPISHSLPLIVAITACISGLVCVCAVAWLLKENSTAKGLAFAASALLAAMIGTALNAYYELQAPDPREAIFFSDYTVDRVRLLIAQYKYPLGNGFGSRPHFEEKTGTLTDIRSANINLGEGLEATIRDLATVSFIQFLVTDYPGWGGTTISGRMFGGENARTAQLSKDCQQFDIDAIKRKLVDSGNIFANAAFSKHKTACLPPDTLVIVSRNEVSLESAYGTLKFESGELRAVNQADPETGASQPTLDDGHSVRFSRVATLLKLTANIKWGYAKNHRLEEYVSWQDDITKGAVEWFESFPVGEKSDKLPFISPFRNDGVKEYTNED